MARRIKVMPEYGIEPLFIEKEDGRWERLDYEELQEMFGVPDHVIQAFEVWDRPLQDAVNAASQRGLGWRSPEEEAHWSDQIHTMAELLAAHVPDDVQVVWGFD